MSTNPSNDVVCVGNTFVLSTRIREGRVEDAWSTGKMVRIIDALLKKEMSQSGEPHFVQRAYCLCNDAHTLATVRAFEAIAGVTPPKNARLVRSLVQAVQCIQDHLLHFYHFYLEDWASTARALHADPRQSMLLAACQDKDTPFFKEFQNSLRIKAQQTAHRDHSAYQGEDALHLLLLSHVQDSLAVRSTLSQIIELLGCKGICHAVYEIGGLSDSICLDASVRDAIFCRLDAFERFVAEILLPDQLRIAGAYPQWTREGRFDSFLTWGDFTHPAEDALLYPSGVFTAEPDALNGMALHAHPAAPQQVRELDASSWTSEDADYYRLRFGSRGPSCRWSEQSLSWITAPRHDGMPYEVGPLARVLGAYASGESQVRPAVDAALSQAKLPLQALCSTMGRVLARGIECACLVAAAKKWLTALDTALTHGDSCLRHPYSLPACGSGLGLVEVSRGGLLHRVELENNTIIKHDYLIPTLWGFSPRGEGRRGPLEQALLQTPVADAAHPLEILRTVHAFDPCNTQLLLVDSSDTEHISLVTAK